MTTLAFIAGVSGTELSGAEREFIRAQRPWGFILFKRNIEAPAQVIRLVGELRGELGEPDAPAALESVASLESRIWNYRVQRAQPLALSARSRAHL